MNKITILKSGKPVNKVFTLESAGSIKKTSRGQISKAEARTVCLKSPQEFKDQLEQIANTTNQVIVLGSFNQHELHETFTVMAQNPLREAFNRELKRPKDTELPSGMVSLNNKPTTARLKKNITLCSWILLDFDEPEGFNSKLGQYAGSDIQEKLEALEPVIPNISKRLRIEMRSSSTRVVFDGEAKPHSHAYIQISDIQMLDRFKAHFEIESKLKGLFFKSPNKSKREGEIIGHTSRYLIDTSVWGTGRIIFNNLPEVDGRIKDCEVLDAGIRIVNPNGGVLDISHYQVPNEQAISQANLITGENITIKEDGNELVITESGLLNLKTTIEVKGQIKTLEAWIDYMRHKGEDKLRCETPFRSSQSESAFLKYDDEGVMLYDIGTKTSYTYHYRKDPKAINARANAKEDFIKGDNPNYTPDLETSQDRFNAISELYPKPFKGYMSEVVNIGINASVKPQPSLMLLAVLIGMSASISGKYKYPDGSRLNLYGAGIGSSGSGKDAVITICRKVAMAGNARVLGKIASGQGLEDALEHYQNTLIQLDELGQILIALSSKNASGYEKEIARLLLTLYSASSSEMHRRTKVKEKKDSANASSEAVKHPCLNFFGVGTPDLIGEAFSKGLDTDGSIGRMLFAFAQDGVKPQDRQTEFKVPLEFVYKHHDAILQAPLKVGADIIIKIDETAKSEFKALMLDFEDEANSNYSNNLAKILLVRSFEKSKRIAGVLAVFDNPELPLVTYEHLSWARAMVEASNRAIQTFASEYMHGGEVQTNAHKLLEKMKSLISGRNQFKTARGNSLCKDQKLIMKSELINLSKLNTRDFDEAIKLLTARDNIVQQYAEDLRTRNLNIPCFKLL